MYKLCFFVPDADRELVKQALFELGAGKIGNYECCCWQTLGEGQFRPLQGSQPHIGQQGQLETVSEWKVEMVCEDHLINEVVACLKQVHPYETVAYDLWRLEELPIAR